MDNLEYSEKVKVTKIRCMFAIGLERIHVVIFFPVIETTSGDNCGVETYGNEPATNEQDKRTLQRSQHVYEHHIIIYSGIIHRSIYFRLVSLSSKRILSTMVISQFRLCGRHPSMRMLVVKVNASPSVNHQSVHHRIITDVLQHIMVPFSFPP